ncbi:MAG: hypothetical protein V4495_13955 [Pseudomonadota bacterium]
MEHPVYVEKQWFRFLWIFMPLLTLFSMGTQILAGLPLAAWGMLSIPIINALVLLMLGCLTIRLDASHLTWRFGWLGWPVWKVALTDIQFAERTSTAFLEGLGIKKTAQGMLYNATGKLAIRLVLRNGKTLRLGTQDPQRLLSYLTPRLNVR